MVEVFKTNVQCPLIAQQIIADVLAAFIRVEVSFDLEDEDCILRLVIETAFDNLEIDIYNIVRNNGCKAELLTDDFSCKNILVLSNAIGHNRSINAFFNIF